MRLHRDRLWERHWWEFGLEEKSGFEKGSEATELSLVS